MLSRRHRCSLHPVVPPLEVAAVDKEMVATNTSFGGRQYFKVPLAHRYAIFLIGQLTMVPPLWLVR